MSKYKRIAGLKEILTLRLAVWVMALGYSSMEFRKEVSKKVTKMLMAINPDSPKAGYFWA